MMYRLVRAALCVVPVVCVAGVARAEEAPLASDGGRAECAIVCDRDDALSRRTAERLAAYLGEQTGATPPVIDDEKLAAADPHRTLIVIDGTADQRLLAKVGSKADVPADRADAYALKVVHRPDHWIVAAAGRTPAGAKYAAYRLMEEMRVSEGHDAGVREMDVHASPFFATRSVSLFNIWRVPVATVRQCNLESWPAEKIQRNVDTYDAFGFNALETHDRFHEDFLKAVYGCTRAEWRERVYAMCDRAHDDGMTMFLRLWGNSVALPVKELKGGFTPFGFVNLTPDIPEEKKRWDAEIRDYASKAYASHIDHLIGHWADAGGVHDGSHATVKDSMLLHNELVEAFRSINPKLQSSFNLWGMANPRGHRGWPGYVDHRSIADAGILPKDVAIAQTTRSHSHDYSEQVTKDIVASGHPAAVWTWRRADTEVRFGDAGIRVRVHDLIGNYFHGLPESARKLQWHNIERNHHGLANDVNYYVAGKLMWDPKADVDALESKYCSLVFGEANAAAVVEAFNVIETSRHIEQFVSDRIVAHPAEGAKRARAALEALNKIDLPAGHHSRLPSVTSPQEILEQLRGTLAAIAENGEIIAGQLPALDALVKSGKTAEANALAAKLRAKADAWFGTVTGGVEGAWLKEALKDALPAALPEDADADAPSATKAGAAGFVTRGGASVAPAADGGVLVEGTGKDVGVALRELTPAATGAVEFRFRFKPTPTGASRNGGIAFGPSDAMNNLTRCHVYFGRGGFLLIDGAGVTEKRVQAPGLDATAEQECVVRVDPNRHVVTFTVGRTTAEAAMTADARPIKFYGYGVKRTATRFGPVEVKALP